MSLGADGYWITTKNKEKTRRLVCKSFGKRLPKTSIFLPGVDIACLKKIYEAGFIRPYMVIHVVERRPDVMPTIKQKISDLDSKLFKQCRFHQSELHEVKLDGRIDFSYIDLLGNFTPELLEWFRKEYLAKANRPCVTFLTLQKAYRGNLFMRSWRYKVVKTPAMFSVFRKHRSIQIIENPSIQKHFYNRKFPFTLWLLDGIFAETKNDFKYRIIHPYRDCKDGKTAVTMIFTKIVLTAKRKETLAPDLKSIDVNDMINKFAERPKEIIKPRNLKRKLAGQRAALTRAINSGKLHKVEHYQNKIALIQLQIDSA